MHHEARRMNHALILNVGKTYSMMFRRPAYTRHAAVFAIELELGFVPPEAAM